MALLSSTTADNAHTLLDYQVVDKSGTDIGTVHSFWADTQTGALEFIGVKTGWLFGHNHVIPVEKVEIDESGRHVRVPYDSEFVKGAMSINADSEISDEQETEIYRYFGLHGAGLTSTTTGGSYAGSLATHAKDEVTHATDTVSHAASNVAHATETAALGAASLVTGGATAASTAAHHTDLGKDDLEVALTEESVAVGKRTVDAGQVRLRKIVRTEVVNQPVEIRHEDVVVERVSADQVHSGAGTSNFEEEVINVPLTREEVVVQKEAHVTGGVRLHKTEETEHQTVSETVRKEDVEVIRDGKTVTEHTEVKH